MINIREVAPDDAEALVHILNPIIETKRYTVLTTPLTVEAEREFIETFPKRGIFHVAVREQDDRVVGMQNVAPVSPYAALEHIGEIGTFVHLDLLRRGIARRLFEATFSAVRKKGYKKLFTFVRADNPGALKTYLGQGFRVVGTAERHASIGDAYVDEMVIEKWLG